MLNSVDHNPYILGYAMMSTHLFPLLAYILISTFTPGPSNISSASMGILHGYKNTLIYQFGLAAGVFFVMLLSGWISTTLLRAFPTLEPALRYAGAAYILYLAFGILTASYMFTEKDVSPLGFVHGFVLQILNPKLVIYAFTLFSAFLAPVTNNLALLVLVATLLSVTAFGATSVWAVCGAAIKTYLHQPRVKAVVNGLLALLLVYSAFNLMGVL
jgi:cysteine/O-acetylserine efflux protein